jgi:CubicO group peptidase (beta-lactamase class C family)
MHVGSWKAQAALFCVSMAAFTAYQIMAAPRPDNALQSMDASELASYWDEHIPELLDTYGVEGVAVLVLEDGEPTFRAAYGFADVGSEQPMTTDSVMMAHSISKSLTAWGVMTLVADGEVELDAPVSSYLSGWEFPASDHPTGEVTVRRLLSLSAGVPLGEFGVHLEPGTKLPDLRQKLRGDAVRLRREPGSGFEYSNTSFALLEFLIEEVSGRDFADYMDEEVLEPLGMEQSSFQWQDRWEDRVPTGYTIGHEPIPPYQYPYRASGGLFTTLDDLGQFASASMGRGRGVLSSSQIAEMHRSHVEIPGMFGVVADSYGLGHFLETLPDSKRAAWHGGQGLGWMTHFHVVPSTGDGVVILANSQRSWPFFARLLDEWSTWAGVGRPGMARITTLTVAMRILIGAIVLVTLWLLMRVVHGRVTGARRSTGRQRPGGVQIAQGILGGAILALLGWAVAQDYLFISSIFPDDSLWFGASLLAVATALLAAAAMPVRD